MSKAFTKEEEAAAIVVSPRAPLPVNQINYVTATGMALLKQEQLALEQQLSQAKQSHDRELLTALNQRLIQLEQRITTAQVVSYDVAPTDTVRFGAKVTLMGEHQQPRQYRIVGVDEAAPNLGNISFLSPLAAQLLGLQLDDEVMIANSDDDYYIDNIEYDD